MKKSYEEQLAIDFGHKPYAGSGDAPGVAWVRGDAGQPLSSDIKIPVCRPCPDKGKATSSSPPRQGDGGHGGVIEPVHASKFQAREPGDPVGFRWELAAACRRPAERSENVTDGTADMNAKRKSDGPIVPAKRTNKTGTPAAESVEERGSPKGRASSILLLPDSVPEARRHRWGRHGR